MVLDERMAKKITAALKELKKALDEHAETVGGTAVSLKKAERSNARVAAAANAYAKAVKEKSGVTSPFDGIKVPGLQDTTVASLIAERDAIKKKVDKSDSV